LPETPAPAGPPPRNPQPTGFRRDFLDALPVVGKRRTRRSFQQTTAFQMRGLGKPGKTLKKQLAGKRRGR